MYPASFHYWQHQTSACVTVIPEERQPIVLIMQNRVAGFLRSVRIRNVPGVEKIDGGLEIARAWQFLPHVGHDDQPGLRYPRISIGTCGAHHACAGPMQD